MKKEMKKLFVYTMGMFLLSLVTSLSLIHI